MDLPADIHKADEQQRSQPILNVVLKFRELIGRLLSFFTFTEEERLRAGIVWRQRP